MTKHFCDRCGKECEKLNDIKIPQKKTQFGYEAKTIQVCRHCEQEYEDINDRLIDIRFVLFGDFMKGGAE